MMASHRYCWIAFTILLVGLLPTLNSFYRGLPIISNQISAMIPTEINAAAGSLTGRSSKSIVRNFGTNDWVERSYFIGDKTRLNLFAARGYDCRPFFHMPEYGILDRAWDERIHTLQTWKDDGSNIYVHELELVGWKHNQKAYYILIHDNQTIGHPYSYLLYNIPKMMVKKSQLYTLIFVSYKYQASNAVADSHARELLLSVLNFCQNKPGL